MQLSTPSTPAPDAASGPLADVPSVFRRSRYSRREIYFAWTALGALVALQLLLARYWLDLIDEGYFADLADRVARGELPYRDFATPYTPALHYLHAWAFGLLGRDIVSMRLVLVLVKALLAVLLYVLGRRLMPPSFAALPVVLVFCLDSAPLMWEPHPAWYALTLAVLTVWALTRLIEGGSDRWILLAGSAAGLSCAFKQNIGLFVLAAAAGFLLFRSADLGSGRARIPLPRLINRAAVFLVGRIAFSLGIMAALAWLLRAYLDPKVALVFLAPLGVIAGNAMADALHRTEHAGQREVLAGRLLWLFGSALGAVALWATPLVAAVGPSNMPLAQFVGAFDLTGFYWALIAPRFGFAFYLLAALACPIAIQRLASRAPFYHRLFEAAGLFLLAAIAFDVALVDTALANPDLDPDDATPWALSVRAAESVLIYLPTLAFWGGLAGFATTGLTLTRTAQLAFRWYLLAGSLLLFNLFPRMDTMHITYSGPPLFIVGVFGLYCVYRALDRRLPESAPRLLCRALIFASLLVLPAVAVIPGLEWRAEAFFSDQDGVSHFDPPDYVPFGVSGASVLVPASSRDAIGGAAEYLRGRTAPGEPIFAYPTVPMFYFLADRPNATRFGHLYPGAATEEEQRQLIATLEQRGVHYVVWDQYWVDQWGADGRYVMNETLTDYLLRRYHTETMVGPFHILARDE